MRLQHSGLMLGTLRAYIHILVEETPQQGPFEQKEHFVQREVKQTLFQDIAYILLLKHFGGYFGLQQEEGIF